jgi:D-alanyl-D-alanine endopeptidase (penicillin-binding protein 7)
MQRGAILITLGACLALTTVAPAHAKRSSDAPIASLTRKGMPNVQSAAAVAWDAESGEIVYAKNADQVRSIASTTKIFVAMVVRRHKLDLDALTEITNEDARYAKGGSRTRLVVGHKFRNQDLLRAMLISSDNRACTAVARAAGLNPKKLIKEMNRLAKDLGLKKTKFTDPSGLNGNTSTAREMSKGMAEAMKDSFLAEIMSTKDTTVRSVASKSHVIHYRNTNRSLHSGRYDVRGGKTGFTTAAGYCLLIEAKVGGRRLHMTFLGAKEKLTRFGDFGRVAGWVENKSNDAK